MFPLIYLSSLPIVFIEVFLIFTYFFFLPSFSFLFTFLIQIHRIHFTIFHVVLVSIFFFPVVWLPFILFHSHWRHFAAPHCSHISSFRSIYPSVHPSYFSIIHFCIWNLPQAHLYIHISWGLSNFPSFSPSSSSRDARGRLSCWPCPFWSSPSCPPLTSSSPLALWWRRESSTSPGE